jgi:hypothetical protein
MYVLWRFLSFSYRISVSEPMCSGPIRPSSAFHSGPEKVARTETESTLLRAELNARLQKMTLK